MSDDTEFIQDCLNDGTPIPPGTYRTTGNTVWPWSFPLVKNCTFILIPKAEEVWRREGVGE